ncbi:O-antigen ligase family protein [Gehongia tenuis]|uniref:O-antigen ligase family protein n=1 Tax=Gehongia tenuis TaxID=2763655 RepID=A0A926D4B5_9FIRM|nr:O-antigen ligase family protein [Gehongia tenuis]MBC8531316.1 O-antigen ligase family protein [Gehongia tenuis]
MLLFLPIIIRKYSTFNLSKLENIFNFILLSGIFVLVFTLSSRAIFFCLLVETALFIIINLKRKRIVLRILSALVCSTAIVAILFCFDVGDVRYSVYRETGFTSIFQNNPSFSEPVPSHPLSEDEERASAQIGRSDTMRKSLARLSIERVKENLWFGTGDIFYAYSVSGQDYQVAPHNFILATLNCYGLVGLIIIAALMIVTLIQTGLLKFRGLRDFLTYKSTYIVTLLLFLGLSLLQATAYDVLLMPLLFVVTAIYAKSENYNI